MPNLKMIELVNIYMFNKILTSVSKIDLHSYNKFDFNVIFQWFTIKKRIRHLCTMEVPKFISPNIVNFLNKSSGIKCLQ